METPVIISFIVYMLAMIAIGVYFYFKTNDLSDYVLGGRGLGPGVTALSAGASDMSGGLLLGLPGMMYSEGIVGSWIAVGLIIGAYLNWHYVAKPLRVYTHTSTIRLRSRTTFPTVLKITGITCVSSQPSASCSSIPSRPLRVWSAGRHLL